jgi:hypothetical protein
VIRAILHAWRAYRAKRLDRDAQTVRAQMKRALAELKAGVRR